jgi:hypothetical protein
MAVNIRRIDNHRYEEPAVSTSPELVALIQRERERHIEQDHLARVAACVRACCSPSIIDRLASVLRPAPETC